MRYEEKAEKLAKLSELEFRRQVLIPLLSALAFSDVYENHGPNEKGKDLIFREVGRLKEVLIHAAVVSKRDITAKVGDSRSVERVKDQVRLALEEPYKDKYTGKTTSVARCWVITSGRIFPSAIESISGHFQRNHLDKLVHFLDSTRVIGLLDEAYPQYWERTPELAYYSSHCHVDISTNQLDAPYDRDVDDLPNAGNLNATVYRIKKAAYSLLLEVESDTLDKLAKILRSNHPWETLSLWEQLRDSFHHRQSSETHQIEKEWHYLLDDLHAYEERFDIRPEERQIPKKPWEG